jgi:hypothetical protein
MFKALALSLKGVIGIGKKKKIRKNSSSDFALDDGDATDFYRES